MTSAILPVRGSRPSCDAQQVGCGRGGRAQGRGRAHAVVDHQGELLGVDAVRARRGVGAEGDLDADLSALLNMSPRAASAARALSAISGGYCARPCRRVLAGEQRRHEVGALSFIIAQRVVVEERAVLDRVDAGADGDLGRLRRRGQWAATLRPQRWASSTIAFISSCVSCGASTASASESTPPDGADLDHVGAVLDLVAHGVAELRRRRCDAILDARLGAEAPVAGSRCRRSGRRARRGRGPATSMRGPASGRRRMALRSPTSTSRWRRGRAPW